MERVSFQDIRELPIGLGVSIIVLKRPVREQKTRTARDSRVREVLMRSGWILTLLAAHPAALIEPFFR